MAAFNFTECDLGYTTWELCNLLAKKKKFDFLHLSTTIWPLIHYHLAAIDLGLDVDESD